MIGEKKGPPSTPRPKILLWLSTLAAQWNHRGALETLITGLTPTDSNVVGLGYGLDGPQDFFKLPRQFQWTAKVDVPRKTFMVALNSDFIRIPFGFFFKTPVCQEILILGKAQGSGSWVILPPSCTWAAWGKDPLFSVLTKAMTWSLAC